MAYNFHTRLTRLGERLQEVAGVEVVYSRGPHSIPLTATPINAFVREFIPGVLATRIKERDWSFDSADLVIQGTVVAPQPGDLITDSYGNRYRVSPRTIPGSEAGSCFIYTTTTEDRIRVFTEQVS